jgi:DNA-binding transcriptional ArsR family regulator
MSASPSLDDRLIKALAHPLRWRMLEVLTESGEASPVQLARLLDQPLATVSHHMRVLRDMQCVELVRTEPRRGAVEHYYQPLMPAFFDAEQWARVPGMLRRRLASDLFRLIVEESAAAGDGGAFDVPTAHMDRLFVELDDHGRRELSDLLIDTMRRAQAIQERSDARRADESQVRLSEVVLLHFERGVDGELPARSPAVPAA